MQNNRFDNCRIGDLEIFEEQNKIEASLNLSETHFDKILSLSGDVVCTFCEVQSGELKYGGRMTFNVVYLGDGLERLETGAEFSFKKIGAFEDGKCQANLRCGELNLKRNGGMLYVETVLNSCITYEKDTEATYLADTSVLKKMDMIEIAKNLQGQSDLELDDEFDCVKLQKVLYSSADATILSVEAQNGAVRCDGEVFLTLVLLPFGQNNDIVKERRVIPFSYELDVDGVTADATCYANAEVGKLSLKVYATEDDPKSTVNSTVSVTINAFAQQKEKCVVVGDIYSKTNQVTPTHSTYPHWNMKGYECQTKKASGKFMCAVPENSRFLGIVGERVEVVSCGYSESCYKLDILVSGDGIFTDGEGELVSRSAVLPLSFNVECEQGQMLMPTVKLSGLSAKLRNGEIEGEVALKASFVKGERTQISVISDVVEGDLKPVNNSAISVYVGKKGDDEWDVMKAFGEDIDKIYEFNPMINFPLSGGEKILCYRQLEDK